MKFRLAFAIAAIALWSPSIFAQDWSPFKEQFGGPSQPRPKAKPEAPSHIKCIKSIWPQEKLENSDAIMDAARKIRSTCFSYLYDVLSRLEKERRGLDGTPYVDRNTFYELWNAAIVNRLVSGNTPDSLPSGWPSQAELPVFKSLLKQRLDLRADAYISCLRDKVDRYSTASSDSADSIATMVLGLCTKEFNSLSNAICEEITVDRCTPELRERTRSRQSSYHPRVMELVLKRRSSARTEKKKRIGEWVAINGAVEATSERFAAGIVETENNAFLLVRCFAEAGDVDITVGDGARKGVGESAVILFLVDGEYVGDVLAIGEENQNELRLEANSSDAADVKSIAEKFISAKHAIGVEIDSTVVTFSVQGAASVLRSALSKCIPLRPSSTASSPLESRNALPAARTAELTRSPSAKAPFKVTNSPGRDVYWKLTRDGRTAVSGFVRQGDNLVTKAPMGCYKFRYATGADWLGEADLFGAETEIFEADGDFCFSQDGDRMTGHQINLNLVKNGNLRVKKLGREGF